MRKTTLVVLASVLILASGCIAPRIKLFPSQADPLLESTLEGKTEEKILVIPIRGIISDTPEEGFLRAKPSVVQEVVSHLRKAAQDKMIKAVVLQLDSPGGSVTGSDILYHEIVRFKEATGRPVVAAMMDVAASGAYYIALPADRIIAHPTTVTGSVGVIFIRPKVSGLMDKIGVAVEVNKSGINKDIGSPFRATTAEEEQIFQAMTDQLGKRFIELVARHRHLDPAALNEVASARVFLADQALSLKLVDSIGYMSDGLKEARTLSNLPEDARVVVYRRTRIPERQHLQPGHVLRGQPAGRPGGRGAVAPHSIVSVGLLLPVASGGSVARC